MLKQMKKETRILGVSAGYSENLRQKRTMEVVGVVFRGRHWLEGVMTKLIRRDDLNATAQIAEMIMASPHFDQIRLIMTDGSVFEDRRVDTEYLHKSTGIPVVAVAKRTKGKKSLKSHVKGADEPIIMMIQSNKKQLEVYRVGLSLVEARSALKMSCNDDIPEPIRVARLFASAFNRFLGIDSTKIKLRS